MSRNGLWYYAGGQLDPSKFNNLLKCGCIYTSTPGRIMAHTGWSHPNFTPFTHARMSLHWPSWVPQEKTKTKNKQNMLRWTNVEKGGLHGLNKPISAGLPDKMLGQLFPWDLRKRVKIRKSTLDCKETKRKSFRNNNSQDRKTPILKAYPQTTQSSKPLQDFVKQWFLGQW